MNRKRESPGTVSRGFFSYPRSATLFADESSLISPAGARRPSLTPADAGRVACSHSSPGRAWNDDAVIRPACVHADRAVGGDRDHRDPDRAAPARGPESPGGRQPVQVYEQPEAARAGVTRP